MNFCYDFTMKSAPKSRNISRRKMGRAVLQRRWQEGILEDWLNYLSDPVFSTTIRPSGAKTRLHTVRREIARLKKMDGCFVSEDGSLHTHGAVAHLEEEERHLLCETRNRTYQCQHFRRTAPKGLGNIELAERIGVSVRIIRGLKPRENVYDVLQKDLAAKKVWVESKAIQMRVRRLEKRIRVGQHLSWDQILQHHYRCYKFFVGSNLWLSRFKGFPPVGYLKKCLTLTRPEINLLRRLIAVPKPQKV